MYNDLPIKYINVIFWEINLVYKENFKYISACLKYMNYLLLQQISLTISKILCFLF